MCGKELTLYHKIPNSYSPNKEGLNPLTMTIISPRKDIDQVGDSNQQPVCNQLGLRLCRPLLTCLNGLIKNQSIERTDKLANLKYVAMVMIELTVVHLHNMEDKWSSWFELSP